MYMYICIYVALALAGIAMTGASIYASVDLCTKSEMHPGLVWLPGSHQDLYGHGAMICRYSASIIRYICICYFS